VSVHSKDGATWSTKLKRISERAASDKTLVFNNLGHVIDEEMLQTIHRLQAGNKAVGVDGVDKNGYGTSWSESIAKLLQRIRRGTYYPQAALVVEIPKPDGGSRPLAISCYEDKLVQGAVHQILETLFEPLFLDCSYGFRPNRNCHDALKKLNQERYHFWNGAVVEIDIRKCFDSIPHAKLEQCLGKRISDRRFLRLVMALVKTPKRLPSGETQLNDCGCPQGSKISPLLCNIYLHYVLDEWFAEISKSHLIGCSAEIRYCDDMVFLFEKLRDAERFYKVLPKRLGHFGLQLHDDKSQLVRSGHLAAAELAELGQRLKTFKFLGFICYFAKSNNGYWVPKYRSCGRRFSAKLKKLKGYLMDNLNTPDTVQLLKCVIVVVRGWVNYHAISDNNRRVGAFLELCERILFKWYNRRGGYRPVTWSRFSRLLKVVDFPKTWTIVSMYTAH
jgi:RNA-directed DNA polymerase